MIIHHSKYNTVNYKEYKRIFAFGCSFTNYFFWPTWADIIAYESKNAEFYNFGQTGAGNLFIMERIIAANQKFKFTQGDLILVMWSTHCREDRYKDDEWVTPGNIFTQDVISLDFVKEWADIKGYVVRDLAFITAIKYILEGMSCDAVVLRSVQPDYDKKWYDGNTFDEVLELYNNVITDMPTPLSDFVRDKDGNWIEGHRYFWYDEYGTRTYKLDKEKKSIDWHPNPLMYLNYLTGIGFKFSKEVEKQVETINSELLKLDHAKKIHEWVTTVKNTTVVELV